MPLILRCRSTKAHVTIGKEHILTMSNHPLYAHEHCMQEGVIPIVIFLATCLGWSTPGTHRYKTCVSLLHHFGAHGSWGAGEITEAKLTLTHQLSTNEDESSGDDLKQSLRIVETVEQLLSGQRYGDESTGRDAQAKGCVQ
jgi:hypothetical protein